MTIASLPAYTPKERAERKERRAASVPKKHRGRPRAEESWHTPPEVEAMMAAWDARVAASKRRVARS